MTTSNNDATSPTGPQNRRYLNDNGTAWVVESYQIKNWVYTIVGLRHYSLSGLRSNVQGTPCQFQSLQDWEEYCKRIRNHAMLRQARVILYKMSDHWHDFYQDQEEFAGAVEILNRYRKQVK